MKKLEEYETPLTDAEVKRRWELLKTTSIGNDFARDLERKLAMCRDALRNCRNALANRHAEQSYYSSDVEEALHISTKTLESTEPK